MTKSKVQITSTILVILLGFSIQTFSQTNKKTMQKDKNERIGLLVTMKAKPGKEEAVRDFLIGGLAIVNDEPGTASWYAFQIDQRTFGIFDTFKNEEGRQAHLSGKVAQALLANAESLLDDFEINMSIQPIDLVASSLTRGAENKGLLVIMNAKEGKSKEVEDFLLSGKELVIDEPKTVSWYAIQIAPNTYAIFDTFADDSGRDMHLNGQVAAALMKHAPLILEGFESKTIQSIDILASK